jgi:hypothetical protein
LIIGLVEDPCPNKPKPRNLALFPTFSTRLQVCGIHPIPDVNARCPLQRVIKHKKVGVKSGEINGIK